MLNPTALAACLAGALTLCRASGEDLPSLPMAVTEEDTAESRWRQKPVLDSRLLSGMETTNGWSHHGPGRLTLSEERAHEGRRALRLAAPTKGLQPGPVAGRPFGESVARWEAGGENWDRYNRLSVWVYPHLPGFKVISLLVKLHNDGAIKVPDDYGREGLNYVILKPDQWNQVVFEIAHLNRDRVTAVELIYRQQGNEPGATDTAQFDLDQLELQVVDADPYEGWSVAPGRIAYSHVGYRPAARKVALVSGDGPSEFELVDARNHEVVFRRPLTRSPDPVAARRLPSDLRLLDFSPVERSGTFFLRWGQIMSRPFRIGPDVWMESIRKTLNFFYAERCGDRVPGIHDVCHEDWRASHAGRAIGINGGWHDAGDLSQGLVNTAEATFAFLALSESVRPGHPMLADRLLEEALWGLDWVQKTRFADGSRVTWATLDFWTDGRIGTVDDVMGEVRNSPYENFIASATEAMASRVLRDRDPARADRSLALAAQDWSAATARMREPGLDLASQGALASVLLFQCTREPEYEQQAVTLCRRIIDCQQREWTDWQPPLCGFFYTSPERARLLHYAHRGHEQAPIVALTAACDTWPNHPDWMEWYAAVARHSEYLKTVTRFTEPYGLLPASAYRVDESNEPRFQAQWRQGIRLDPHHALRVFPIWFDFRGNSGTVLSQAKGLSAAAQLRRDPTLQQLVEWQLEWHVGRNPFAQSLLYGEGHDYAPQYTALSGDLVGSLPVGVQTRGDRDEPYWPAANCYNYKEVWVHPSSRWMWIASDLLRPEPARSAEAPRVIAWGEPIGEANTLRIKARVRGAGKHRLELRAVNLSINTPAVESVLDATSLTELTWDASVQSRREPWVAILVPDGVLADRVEVGVTPPSPARP